jgi:phage tail-like protein
MMDRNKALHGLCPNFTSRLILAIRRTSPSRRCPGSIPRPSQSNTGPATARNGNVTLKKGIFAKDNKFWDWYNQIKLNTIKRVPVTIQLCDEGGNPTMVWTLSNAWPTKITGTDLKSDGNEVAVETLEVAHEGLVVANK